MRTIHILPRTPYDLDLDYSYTGTQKYARYGRKHVNSRTRTVVLVYDSFLSWAGLLDTGQGCIN